MEDLKKILDTPIVKNKSGVPVISVVHLVAVGAGALGLYFMIPERKRKTVFK